MGATFENLRILQNAEEIADEIWEQVAGWKSFEKDVVGGQLARAADSIGANIAESLGRFHYGEKLQFLYYARGSLYETKYWLNRTIKRQLIAPGQAQTYITQLTHLVRQLNTFANGLKSQQKGRPRAIRETSLTYSTANSHPPISEESLEDYINSPDLLFNEDEIKWLQTLPQPE